ncbi:hypothetical protein [Flagellimonas marinaquae]
MKTLKLVCMAMLCMAVSLVSCSPEDGQDGQDGQDGATGPQGIAGVDGVDGADGISCWDLNGNGVGDAEEDINDDGNFDAMDCQGADGVNGNANVMEFAYNLEFFSDYDVLNLFLTDIVEEPGNYAFLYYLDHQNGFRYSIPGPLFNNTRYTRVYTNLDTFELFIEFYNTSDDSSAVVPGGVYTHLIAVAIELTNTGKGRENIMAELKAAGVDTSDYNQVAAYFGLE